MRGNDQILKLLNEVLKAELTAINQYFLHAEMCENWGYERLAAHTRKESIEEMRHAEALMERILFLEGMPNMTELFPLRVGSNVKAQLENDLALELEAIPRLNAAIQTATEAGDNGSRDLFEKILADEEEHVDYLEAQIHAIGEIGLDNYLAQHIHKEDDARPLTLLLSSGTRGAGTRSLPAGWLYYAGCRGRRGLGQMGGAERPFFALLPPLHVRALPAGPCRAARLVTGPVGAPQVGRMVRAAAPPRHARERLDPLRAAPQFPGFRAGVLAGASPRARRAPPVRTAALYLFTTMMHWPARSPADVLAPLLAPQQRKPGA